MNDKPSPRDIAALNTARLLGMNAGRVGNDAMPSDMGSYWVCKHGNGVSNLSAWTQYGLAWLYLIHFHVGIDEEGNAYDNRVTRDVQREG